MERRPTPGYKWPTVPPEFNPNPIGGDVTTYEILQRDNEALQQRVRELERSVEVLDDNYRVDAVVVRDGEGNWWKLFESQTEAQEWLKEQASHGYGDTEGAYISQVRLVALTETIVYRVPDEDE